MAKGTGRFGYPVQWLSSDVIAEVILAACCVAGGLSQTAVNEGAGAISLLSLVFASATLALCLLLLTTLLADLPKAVLAAVVLMAVAGLIDLRAIAGMRRAGQMDFFSALSAFIGVLLLGILQGLTSCRAEIRPSAARALFAPACSLPGAHTRYKPVFGPAAPSGERSIGRHAGLSSGDIATLSERITCPG